MNTKLQAFKFLLILIAFLNSLSITIGLKGWLNIFLGERLPDCHMVQMFNKQPVTISIRTRLVEDFGNISNYKNCPQDGRWQVGN